MAARRMLYSQRTLACPRPGVGPTPHSAIPSWESRASKAARLPPGRTPPAQNPLPDRCAGRAAKTPTPQSRRRCRRRRGPARQRGNFPKLTQPQNPHRQLRHAKKHMPVQHGFALAYKASSAHPASAPNQARCMPVCLHVSSTSRSTLRNLPGTMLVHSTVTAAGTPPASGEPLAIATASAAATLFASTHTSLALSESSTRKPPCHAHA
eukprot:363171-Chlamydomonas_euryale.AAC.10